MIIAGNQPYFFPYIGFWQLVNAADLFLIGDNYNFIKHGWIQRNRILVCGKPFFWGLEVKHISSFKKINETEFTDFNVSQKLNTIYYAYCRAPQFDAGYALIKEILNYPKRNVAEFLFHSIKAVCQYLGINTKFVKSSEITGNDNFKREYRIYDFCQRLGGDTYINAVGGQDLYHFEDFEKHGVSLKFIHPNIRPYKQFSNEFVPGLSILDVIMFNPLDAIKEMLVDCSFIEKETSRQDKPHLWF